MNISRPLQFANCKQTTVLPETTEESRRPTTATTQFLHDNNPPSS